MVVFHLKEVGWISTTICGPAPPFFVSSLPREESLSEEGHFLYMQDIDDQSLEVFDVALVGGKNFSESYASDQFNTVLLNESALTTLGFPNASEAVGKNLVLYNGSKELIISVIKDFHQEPLLKAYQTNVL